MLPVLVGRAYPRARHGSGSRLASKLPPPATLDDDLRDLTGRGLLHHDRKENRFDLHPIVRRYAYDRLSKKDRKKAHTRLRDYFEGVPPVEKVTRLEELAPVIELYHHTVRAGQLDEVRTLYCDRLSSPLYFQLGVYQLQTDLLLLLFPDGEDRPPRLEDESDQAWTLNSLANSYSLSGQPRRAVPLFERQNALQEKLGHKGNLASGLGNVAQFQMPIGALRTAEANLRRSIVRAGTSRTISTRRLATRNWAGCWPARGRSLSPKPNWRRH